MTVDEAAAHEVAMLQATDAERERDADDWIISDRGFKYRVIELT